MFKIELKAFFKFCRVRVMGFMMSNILPESLKAPLHIATKWEMNQF